MKLLFIFILLFNLNASERLEKEIKEFEQIYSSFQLNIKQECEDKTPIEKQECLNQLNKYKTNFNKIEQKNNFLENLSKIFQPILNYTDNLLNNIHSKIYYFMNHVVTKIMPKKEFAVLITGLIVLIAIKWTIFLGKRDWNKYKEDKVIPKRLILPFIFGGVILIGKSITEFVFTDNFSFSIYLSEVLYPSILFTIIIIGQTLFSPIFLSITIASILFFYVDNTKIQTLDLLLGGVELILEKSSESVKKFYLLNIVIYSFIASFKVKDNIN